MIQPPVRRILWAVILLGLACFVPPGAARAQENLLQNPACDQTDDQGRPEGWSSTHSRVGEWELAVDTGVTHTGGGSIRMVNLAEAGAMYPRIFQRVALEANVRYLLTARVRSTTGQATMQVTPGSTTWFGARDYGGATEIPPSEDWLEITKRFTSHEPGEAAVVFTLVTPNREAADLWVDHVALIAEAVVEPPPPAPEHRTFPLTDLVREGRAACAIVYPARPPQYRAMAESIQEAIRAQTGVAPEILPDTAATGDRHPVLRTEYRGLNLVLLGRLGINRALWGVYNRFLCAVDGYYPGGDGYVVRTAANVYSNGANSIILGGSSEAGAARAVDRFLAILADQNAQNATLTLPWLLEAELGGECREVFDQDEAEQRRLGSGRDARRFYVPAMAFYWSGRESYLDIARESLEQILAAMETENTVASHYAMEFFVRAWDMLDDSGLFTDEEIAAVDRAIVRSFVSYGSGREAGYRTMLPYEGTHHHMSDHPNANWHADRTMADFILRKLPATPETEGVRATALTRRALHTQTFERLIRERWRGSTGYADTDVPTMTLFRYALEQERYAEFFDSGNARMAALLHLARSTPQGTDIGLQFGMAAGIVEWRLFLGIAASYYGDGELRAVMDAMRKRGRVHSDVYINGVHAYVPGDELPPVEPRSLLGATAIPQEPTYHRALVEAGSTELPWEATFDLVTVRGGFADQGEGVDALLLSGGRDLPPNTIIRLHLDGRSLLGHTAEGGGHYAQNSLLIQRLSDWQPGEVEPAAELLRVANTPGASYVHSRLPGYEGAVWDRRVVWSGGRFFAVMDRVTATEAGEVLVMANWRPGSGALHDNRWVSGDGEGFSIAPAAARALELIADLDVDPTRGTETAVFRQRTTGQLEAGESVEIANLLFLRHEEGGQDWAFRHHPSGAFMARAAHEGGRLYWLGPVPPGLGESDAEMVVLTGEAAVLFHARRLALGGTALLESAKPVSVEIPLGPAAATVAAALAAHWEQATPHPVQEDAAARIPSDTARLERAWRYEGATGPGLVGGVRQIGPNTWDLGRTVSLAQVSRRDRGTLPDLLTRTEPDGEWLPFDGDRQTVGMVTMHNYAGLTLHEDGYETLRGGPQPARFVRAQTDAALSGNGLLFYDADSPGTSDPLRAIPVNLRGPEQPDIMVVPDIWQGFRDQNHLRHDLIILDAAGQERWRREVPWRMFFTPRALDWHGTGREHVFVGSLDNNLYVYDADGDLVATLNAAETDQPTHGNPLPNNVGLWQPDETGHRKVVMPRYHSHSFFERDGTVEGSARNRSAYWTNDTLPYGLDFTGDGVEDTVSMNAWALLPITQDSVGTATYGDRGSHTGIVSLPRRAATLSGARTLAFEIYGGEGTRLFVARDNMVGIYDLAGGEWTAVWTPEIPVRAAVALPDRGELLCAGRDGQLWRFHLDEDLETSAARSTILPAAVRRLLVLDHDRGDCLAVTDAGILRIDAGDTVTRILPGDYLDAALLPRPEGYRLITVGREGVVEAHDMR